MITHTLQTEYSRVWFISACACIRTERALCLYIKQQKYIIMSWAKTMTSLGQDNDTFLPQARSALGRRDYMTQQRPDGREIQVFFHCCVVQRKTMKTVDLRN